MTQQSQQGSVELLSPSWLLLKQLVAQAARRAGPSPVSTVSAQPGSTSACPPASRGTILLHYINPSLLSALNSILCNSEHFKVNSNARLIQIPI